MLYSRELVILTAFNILPMPVSASAGNPDALNRLKQMSLEDLMAIEITIASQAPQKASHSVAAVYVITQEDIRRMGATSLPEALRGVPGLQVARIDANKWAISIRGFSSLFANKLQVMMDGRILYTPLFSGVNWDIQDTVLEDIERIEIIRGPGASIWGANAVNGVINIITRHTKQTHGSLLAGTIAHERGIATLRYGDRLTDDAHYRVYAKYRHQDNGLFRNGAKATDGWHDLRAGFRLDWQYDENHQITLQSQLYQGAMGSRFTTLNQTSKPGTRLNDLTANIWGGHLQFSWQHTQADQSRQSLQFYYDYEDRDSWQVQSTRSTLDINYQYHFPSWQRHTLSTGLGYRCQFDHIPSGNLTRIRTLFKPTRREAHLFSAFIQDRITLLEKRVWLTLGSKFEHNDYTGFEIQPSIRLGWQPREGQLFWASVSRAVRIPSRWEHDAELLLNGQTVEFQTLSVAPGLTGNPDFDSETVLAYELGFRHRIQTNLHLDVALFYNDYDHLVSFSSAGLGTHSQLDSTIILTGKPDQLLYGESYGVEFAFDWQPREHWNLRATYTYLDIQLHPLGAEPLFSLERREENSTPAHQASLLSSYQIQPGLKLNLFGRYVDRLSWLDTPDRLELDIGVEWQPVRNLTLAFYGRNLLYDQRLEFIERDINLESTQSQREALLKLDWRF